MIMISRSFSDLLDLKAVRMSLSRDQEDTTKSSDGHEEPHVRVAHLRARNAARVGQTYRNTY